MTIPVVWTEGPQGGIHGRSGYGCCTLLNQMFDKYECEHWSGIELVPDCDGAVVIVHGGNEQKKINLLNWFISRLRWVVVIMIGDEAAEFDHSRLVHPNMKRWIQTPRPWETRGDRYFVCGIPGDCQQMLVENRALERDLSFFFAGQDTHTRRHDCIASMQGLHPGLVIGTEGFGQGLSHPEYYRCMTQAKVIPCPSGPETPDSYRACEALEAGAVPVLDGRSLAGHAGYWTKVFGHHPLPIVDDWSDFPAKLEEILSDYERIQRECYDFWLAYKIDFGKWLAQDIKELGGL